MQILSIGLNHTTAPLDLRERLVFNDESVRALSASQPCNLGEMVILSTCNRTELYAVCSEVDFAALETFLAEASSVPLEQFRPHLYCFSGIEVAQHLFRVAAGLDSLVLGEPQILGQVSKAFDLARELDTTGPLLSRLFQAALHAGKRVRSETAIGRNPASVASLAASIAARSVADLAEAQVTVLGAGEMAGLTVKALRKRGVSCILLINRSLGRIPEDVASASFDSLDAVLADTNILIASTGAGTILINREMVEAAMRERPNRPLLLVDIAVPRNIAPEVVEIPNVALYDIDHLNARLEQSLSERLAEVPHAETILEEESNEFLAYLNSANVLPLIAGLRQQAESIRKAELAKTLRRLPNLGEGERAHIEALTRALVSKLLESPTSRLRAEAACPQAPKYAAVARSLFNLPGGQGPCQFVGAVCPLAEKSDLSLEEEMPCLNKPLAP